MTSDLHSNCDSEKKMICDSVMLADFQITGIL